MLDIKSGGICCTQTITTTPFLITEYVLSSPEDIISHLGWTKSEPTCPPITYRILSSGVDADPNVFTVSGGKARVYTNDPAYAGIVFMALEIEGTSGCVSEV